MTPQLRDDDLEAFFAAARAENPAPRTALLSAILADAAEVQAARAPRASLPVPPQRPAGWRFGRLFAPLGGVAALAACAALGFWIGLAGSLTLDGATLTAGETPAYGVDAFFDYASLEE
jgi:ferric-dicitrate binding protein FerR (iron transport regulator)